MKSLTLQIKHAKITTREVFIYLRKNGELKRNLYSKYLKLQYRAAGQAYNALQSIENSSDDIPEIHNTTPIDKKLTMPVDLVRSETSIMSKSFDDISFLTEAWHFYQREMMQKNCECFVAKQLVKEVQPAEQTVSNRLVTQKTNWNHQELQQHTEYNYLKRTTQSQELVTPASGFDNLKQYSEDPLRHTSMCTQVLRWAQEGKLNLN